MLTFIKNILFVILLPSMSNVFGMGHSGDFASLKKLSLQKAVEVLMENYSESNVERFLQRIPQDLHEEALDVIASYLNKTFVFTPMAHRYTLRQGEEIYFLAVSRDSRLVLHLTIYTQIGCRLNIVKSAYANPLARYEWPIDEKCSKFLSGGTLDVDALWNLIPANFLIDILSIARKS
jgi:hypothetical protein